MKLWNVSGDGKPWKVELDVRDLGGHLGFTRRARVGTLSGRVREATHGVAAVGAFPLGLKVKLGLVRGKYLPAGLHAAEASFLSASSLSAFRAAGVRSVWSCMMPLANTPRCAQSVGWSGWSGSDVPYCLGQVPHDAQVPGVPAC